MTSARSHGFAAAANLEDDDALLVLTPTIDTGATMYNQGDWTGAMSSAGDITAALWDAAPIGSLAVYIIITTPEHAGAYNTTDPVTITGNYGGQSASAELTFTDADGGGLRYITDQPFDLDGDLTIVVPDQADDDGEIKIGFSGVACRKAHGKIHPFKRFTGLGTGDVKVGFHAPDSTSTDVLPTLASREHVVDMTRIYGPTLTTAGCIVYE